jgi:hypothetical protein
LQKYVLQLSVQMTPADDFDIPRQVARFRLFVCAKSDEQDFASGPEDDFHDYYYHFDAKPFENGLEICSTLEASITIGIGQLCISAPNANTHTFCRIGGASAAMQAMDVDPVTVAMNIMYEICGTTQFRIRRRHLHFSNFDIETIVSDGGVRCDDDGIGFLSLSEHQTWVCIYGCNRMFDSYSAIMFDNYSALAISATVFGFETSHDCIIFSNMQTDLFTYTIGTNSYNRTGCVVYTVLYITLNNQTITIIRADGCTSWELLTYNGDLCDGSNKTTIRNL